MQSLIKFFFFLILLLFSSCMTRSKEYRKFYSHLQQLPITSPRMEEENDFLIILVEARHLDYTKASKFFCSVAKHPQDGSKNGDVGHAWIYLKGMHDGQTIVIEGGHSGEREAYPARYFDGIMNYNDWGYANPSFKQILKPRYEPNPIKYLWMTRKDGFFQKGSGGHLPTFAAKFSLTQEQFKNILEFMTCHYNYQNYSLVGNQCSTFVTQIAALAGINIPSQMTMKVASYVFFRERWIRLWEDPRYSYMTFATPDVIEKHLIEAVNNGKAEFALNWYLKPHNRAHSH